MIRRAALAALIGSLRLLPPRWSSALGEAIAACLGSRVLATEKFVNNMSIAFPERSAAEIARLVRASTRNFGRVAGELPHLAAFKAGRRGCRVDIDRAAIEPLLADGPAVFVGAHLCNWEIGPVAMSGLSRPVLTIYSNIDDDVIDEALLALRSRGSDGLTERTRAVRAALSGMAAGSNVALLMDQRVGQGHVVPFFGRPAMTSHLPARLAIRFGRPIVPVWGERLAPVHYAVHFAAPLWPDAALSGQAQEIDLTARINGALEEIIRARPEEWFCNKSRWRFDRPAP